MAYYIGNLKYFYNLLYLFHQSVASTSYERFDIGKGYVIVLQTHIDRENIYQMFNLCINLLVRSPAEK